MSTPNDLGPGEARVVSLDGMYQEYFLDYASYVILERAVPAIEDGLKPVQRRILHAMYEMDDGRYHKVANIIGQTMQYHPHGDAAIGDALVNLGQKNLLIDTQGNWGDPRTGDSAAAPRYIEARLTKFALEVAFNPDTTQWGVSYDGRKREPVNLPMKFPLLLAQGAEGIAVGLATKILPHNFIELINASIKLLQGKVVKIYPDFETGGMMDVSDYNSGMRGGKIKVRSRIELSPDKKSLLVKQIPFGVTTETMIESIIKANDKGKIKIKKVVDNTAKDVEIAIELMPGTSPDIAIDALYAFTDCEMSISPNCCVIINNKPHFIPVEEMLRVCTENTKELLRRELDILKRELEEKLHFASLEKIFIEKRIYRRIEECETWDAVLTTIDEGLKEYLVTPSMPKVKGDKRIALIRDITQDDILRLTEIKIKRISKFNTFQADELIKNLEAELEKTKQHLSTLTEYTIAYYENLLKKYGKGKERKTEIMTFDVIQASEVVANNSKLYIDRENGFIGHGLKKAEFLMDCSDIDDIIVFRRNGKFQVVRIAEKVFVGADIMYASVWKKGDERTTYNAITLDGKSGNSMAKRFNVTAITREREYDMSKGDPNSKVLYFTVNPNGESEIVTVQLTQGAKAKIKNFDFDFAELAIKGRDALGNIVTKYPVKKITQKEAGRSTIGARKIWYDEIVGRLNSNERGTFLGDFDTGDAVLLIHKEGSYELTDYELTNRYDPKSILHIGKWSPSQPISVVYFDGNKEWTMVKRFLIETTNLHQRFLFISDHKASKLLLASVSDKPEVTFTYMLKGRKMEGQIRLDTFIDVKGWKALGNKLSEHKLTQVKLVEEKPKKKTSKDSGVPTLFSEEEKTDISKPIETEKDKKTYKPGDIIEFD
jgi:topoisomerase IV subunit A